MSNTLHFIEKNREKLKLLGFFALVLILAWPIANMLADAWEVTKSSRGLGNAIVRALRFIVFASIINSSHQTITAGVFGIFVGLLLLMTIDQKKRWQATLLWAGLIVAIIALQSLGLFLPQLDLGTEGPILVGGIISGVLLGGGRKLLRLQNEQLLEFRRASRMLFFLVSGFVFAALIELHLQYPGVYIPGEAPMEFEIIQRELDLNADGLFVNAFISGSFIITLRSFVKYDAEKNFFILGPRASGKSLFLIGLYLEALDQVRQSDNNPPLEPSQDLVSMTEALDRQDSDWIVESTGRGEIKYLSFQYVHGDVFPINVQISAIDYAGEYLTRLPDAITGVINDEDMDNALRRLVDGVSGADTLLLTIDTERFVNDEPLDISEYFSILQAFDDKNAILVATKSDIMAEEFKNERGLEAHRYYEEFTEYVNTRLRQSQNVDALVTQTGGNTIYPVYYQTKTNEAGDRVPIQSDQGSVMTVGVDELLDVIGNE